ncbi:MAG: hypothetical protein H3C54_10115 [Taibaiella sp.]|nr:hypothetical protein [Taibaiella sp.]
MKTVYLMVLAMFFAFYQNEYRRECAIQLKGEQPVTDIIRNADNRDIQKQTESLETHESYQDFICKKK